MPVFEYKAVGPTGKALKGFVDADTPRAARLQLRRDGVFPTELREGADAAVAEDEPRWQINLPNFGVSLTDQSVATRQLATLVGAGVTVVQALSALAEQTENRRLKAEIARVRDRVNEGASLADALAQGDIFSELYIGMVRAGEAGGALEGVLVRLATYLEDQVRLRNKIGSIIIYPLFMLGFALVVVAALVTVVLPQITTLLASLDQELPIYTVIIIEASEFARTWWWAIGAVSVTGFLLMRAFVSTERGRAVKDRFLLRLPVVGRVTRTVAISRFTRTLATLLSGGIPIVRALATAREVANNTVIGEAVDAARESITEGASLAQPLRASGEFPPMVTHMIEVGEASGELEAMLDKVAQTYDEEVETTVTRLTALLEPFLILIMVGIVLVIILATLVPLLEITSSLS